MMSQLTAEGIVEFSQCLKQEANHLKAKSNFVHHSKVTERTNDTVMVTKLNKTPGAHNDYGEFLSSILSINNYKDK